jgi:hypothetical protein
MGPIPKNGAYPKQASFDCSIRDTFDWGEKDLFMSDETNDEVRRIAAFADEDVERGQSVPPLAKRPKMEEAAVTKLTLLCHHVFFEDI